MSLPEVLQWIAASRKAGMLRLRRRSVEKRILFEAGTIHSSWSNEPRESLSQFLMRDGLVSEEQVVAAFAEQQSQGSGQRQLYGSILVAQGLIDEDSLRNVLQEKASESIYEMFLWPDAEIEFTEGTISDDSYVHIEMRVEEVILEGVRRVDEWARIRQVFPSLKTTFEVRLTPEDVSSSEQQLLRLASEGRSLAQMSLELRRSEFETASLLHGLHSRGAIEVAERGTDTVQPGGTHAAIQLHLDSADEALKEGSYDAAFKTYHDILLIWPDNERACQGLVAVEEARNRELELANISPAAVPVLNEKLALLETQKLGPTEGFVLSRINGEWDVGSILKVCPMSEEQTLLILARFLERGVIEMR
jgi:hypothetical protein